MYSMGVDIGGSHVASCMYEHSYKELVKDTWVSVEVNNRGSKDEIIGSWIYAITQTVSKLGLPFEGIGLAMPGHSITTKE